MNDPSTHRGGTPVGFITELDAIEAASVIYLRLWCDGPEARRQIWTDLATCLGANKGRRILQSFKSLCSLCAEHGRRPLMRRTLQCKCLGADEACFANFVATAATGDHEDAMLIATLLVRPDVAPLITALAADFGLAVKQMQLADPRSLSNEHQNRTLH